MRVRGYSRKPPAFGKGFPGGPDAAGGILGLASDPQDGMMMANGLAMVLGGARG